MEVSHFYLDLGKLGLRIFDDEAGSFCERFAIVSQLEAVAVANLAMLSIVFFGGVVAWFTSSVIDFQRSENTHAVFPGQQIKNLEATPCFVAGILFLAVA